MGKKNTVFIWLLLAIVLSGTNIALFIKDSVGHLEKSSALVTAFVGTSGVQIGHSGPANLLIKLVNSDDRYRVTHYSSFQSGRPFLSLNFERPANFFLAGVFPAALTYRSRVADFDTVLVIAISDRALIVVLGKTLLMLMACYVVWRILQNRNERKLKLRVASERWEIANQVAHDLRSPLSAIKLLTKTVADYNHEGGLLLQKSVARLEKIAADLLSPKGTYEFVANCDASIRSLVDERVLAWPELKFELNLQASCCLAYLQESTFDRIVANLLINSYEAGSKTINICSQTDGIAVSIYVSDSGTGISSELLKRLGKGRVSSKVDGNGLGLTYVNAQLQKIGGDLKVSTVPGKGTTIQLVFPLQQ